MSEATLRALVNTVLSSGAVPRIRFKIDSYVVNGEAFSRLKNAIRAGKLNFEIDDNRLTKLKASAAYNPARNTMTLASSMLKSTAISQKDRSSIIHECLHAVLDMDRVQGISPYQEETVCCLTSSLYVYFHFNRILFKPEGNATALTRKVVANPGMNVTFDETFQLMYEQVCEIYDADGDGYGNRPGVHDGI